MIASQDCFDEIDLLKPAVGHDENSWPEFQLDNIELRDNQGHLVSLFRAGDNRLLCLQGYLNLKSSQYHYARDYQKADQKAILKRNPALQISQVGRYAYGDHGIWAAGKAGWYILSPSKSYRPIFSDMKQGVETLYFISELLDQGISQPEEIVKRLSTHYRISQVEVNERLKKHVDFLSENLEKESTKISILGPMIDYLGQLSGKTRAPKAPKALPRETTTSLPFHPTPDKKRALDAPEPANPKSRTRTTRLRKLQAAAASYIPRTIGSTEALKLLAKKQGDAASLWKFMGKRLESKNTQTGHINLEHTARHLFKHFEFQDPEQARNYLVYQADILLSYMRERRRLRIWGNTPIFKELQSVSLTPAFTAKMSHINIVPRYRELDDDDDEDDDNSHDTTPEMGSSDDDSMPIPITRSSLRPRGQKGKYYKGHADERERSESLDEDGTGQLASVPLPARTQKVNLHWRHSPAASAGAENNKGTSESVTTFKVDQHVAIDPTPLKSADVWECSVYGCNEVVYGVTDELGKQLVSEHIEKHQLEEDADEHVQVAVREMKRTNLSVSNLIKRIREFNAARQLAAVITEGEKPEPRLPPPIKRLHLT